jgi:hypothetical protein
MALVLDHHLILRPYSVGTSAPEPLSTAVVQERRSRILIFEYKLRLSPAQQAAIDEAIRTTQFIRNKCVRLWMDGRGVTANDLQVLCSRCDSVAATRTAPRIWRLVSERAHARSALGVPGEQRTN